MRLRLPILLVLLSALPAAAALCPVGSYSITSETPGSGCYLTGTDLLFQGFFTFQPLPAAPEANLPVASALVELVLDGITVASGQTNQHGHYGISDVEPFGFQPGVYGFTVVAHAPDGRTATVAVPTFTVADVC